MRILWILAVDFGRILAFHFCGSCAQFADLLPAASPSLVDAVKGFLCCLARGVLAHNGLSGNVPDDPASRPAMDAPDSLPVYDLDPLLSVADVFACHVILHWLVVYPPHVEDTIAETI